MLCEAVKKLQEIGSVAVQNLLFPGDAPELDMTLSRLEASQES